MRNELVNYHDGTYKILLFCDLSICLIPPPSDFSLALLIHIHLISLDK